MHHETLYLHGLATTKASKAGSLPGGLVLVSVGGNFFYCNVQHNSSATQVIHYLVFYKVICYWKKLLSFLSFCHHENKIKSPVKGKRTVVSA